MSIRNKHFDCTINPTLLLEWLLFRLLVSFMVSKKGFHDDKFHDHVMCESFLGRWCFSLFASLEQSSALSFKMCYREESDICQIHRINKICLVLATIEEFTTAAQRTVAKRCLSSQVHFFESVAETNSVHAIA